MLRAAKRFDRIGTADGRAAALALIAKINGWSEEDARNYVAAAEAKRRAQGLPSTRVLKAG